MPRVSICIPAYKPDFFEVCIRSALAQTYSDLEIVVSDDCPSDAIEKICFKYREFVRYERNPSPGLEKNVIRLLERANGEYIKYLFDDDLLHPFCVQYLFELMESTREHGVSMALSPRYIINDDNQITQLVDHFRAAGGTKFIGGRDFIRITALKHLNLVGEFTTVLFRRADAYRADGSFRLFKMVGDESPHLIDLSAFIELAELGPFAIHQVPLSFFRHHQNATSNPSNNPRFIGAITYYEVSLNYAIDQGYLSDVEIKEGYRNLAALYGGWVASYPQLSDRIAQIQAKLAV